ncbi:MAG: DNA mismatch repair endonuclease MutL [Herpetosiphonaceae bacterium]|nr:DNA mismatch repair endonuclease MutL [Herpetosiphonaceae bacterium]
MPIRVLDSYVAGQIAAGEVVERPYSIVKELIENAIDAQAGEIRVEIREGGRREIRVVDNGLGIAPDEVELAFHRHATSKLQTADDLFDIHTLGFRGEALPSIAAVAQVVCTSRIASADTGVELRIAGGEIQGRSRSGGTPGTSFVVRNLFYNAPVRLKFLRSDASEAAQISAIVGHYALAYPHIRWTLLIDGRLSLQTPGNGQLLDALIELYGLDVAKQLLPVEDAAGEGEQATRITGYVSQPSLHRSARSSLHLFVNRRWIQARGQLAFVIEEAYHTLLMKGRHPLAVLNIEVDPGAVDVNVHPTKSEVKFLHEPQVFALIGRAVRAALADQIEIQPLSLGAPPANGDTLQRRIELRPAPPSRAPEPVQPPSWSAKQDAPPATPWLDEDDGDDDEAPASSPVAPPPVRANGSSDRAAAPPVADFTLAARPPIPRPQQVSLGLTSPADLAANRGPTSLPPLRVVGQVAETYVVAEAPDGMYLIDQHAAHERVVYERLMGGPGQQPLDQQHLLLPVRPALPPAVATLLLGHTDDLLQWGFVLEQAGSELTVTGVPAGLLEAEIGPALQEMAEHLNSGNGSTPEDWREKVLTTVACHSAIRAGQTLSHEEMRQLLQQLERCAFPRSCPHGRPTALLLSQSQLDRQFGRKG